MTNPLAKNSLHNPVRDREFELAIRAAWLSFVREQRPGRGLFYGVPSSIITAVFLSICIGKSGLISGVFNGLVVGCVVGLMMQITGRFVERKWGWYAAVFSLLGYVLANAVGVYLLSRGYTSPVTLTLARRGMLGPDFNVGYVGMTPLDIVGLTLACVAAIRFARRNITRGQFLQRAAKVKNAVKYSFGISYAKCMLAVVVINNAQSIDESWQRRISG